MDQLYKEYNEIELSPTVGKVRWGQISKLEKFEWKEFPHSYSHNQQILFLENPNYNIKCDFEVERENILSSRVTEYLKIDRTQNFYKVWVIAETIAKLTNTPIWEILKSNVMNMLKLNCENEINYFGHEIKYYNYDKYHFAIGLPQNYLNSISQKEIQN